MTKDLLARIGTAKRAVVDAESQLQKLLGDSDYARRAGKSEVAPGVRTASSKLSAAKAKLDHLDDLLAQVKLDAANEAVGAAETELDRLLEKMATVPSPEKTWATRVVRDALTKLRAAKTTLLELGEPST